MRAKEHSPASGGGGGVFGMYNVVELLSHFCLFQAAGTNGRTQPAGSLW